MIKNDIYRSHTRLSAHKAIEKEAETKTLYLLEQERYRSSLLRAISHDLRTPLSGIMGTSEIIMDMACKEGALFSMAKDIHDDAEWLYLLVENILNLTRLRNGKLALKKQPEALEEIVGSAVARASRRYPDRNISVKVPDTLLMAPVDARLIEQVIINLLENAVKHTQPDNEISIIVSCDETKECAVVTVSDQGEGIPEEDLPYIFQSFYTSRCKNADAKQGAGLGLAICDTAVKAHGGRITAKNQPCGHGAVFTFELPLEAGHDKLP